MSLAEGVIDRWRRVTKLGNGPNWSTPDPPSTRAEIEALESKLGRQLPSLLTDLLLESRAWLWREPKYDAVIFTPPEEIGREADEPAEPMDRIRVERSDSQGVRATFYSAGRITFAFSDYYRFQIDDEPDPGGIRGQIVAIDTHEASIERVADSLEAFIHHGLNCLEKQAAGGYPDDAA